MYRSFDVWAYEQELETGKFCVQSKDFYRQPVVGSLATQLDLQFLELLLEVRPDVRSGSFDSVGS